MGPDGVPPSWTKLHVCVTCRGWGREGVGPNGVMLVEMDQALVPMGVKIMGQTDIAFTKGRW